MFLVDRKNLIETFKFKFSIIPRDASQASLCLASLGIMEILNLKVSIKFLLSTKKINKSNIYFNTNPSFSV